LQKGIACKNNRFILKIFHFWLFRKKSCSAGAIFIHGQSTIFCQQNRNGVSTQIPFEKSTKRNWFIRRKSYICSGKSVITKIERVTKKPLPPIPFAVLAKQKAAIWIIDNLIDS
jgi:hypothetical protein